VIASVRQRKRRDQNPVLLTIPRKGLALRFVAASHTMNATGERLAAKMSSRTVRRVASVISSSTAAHMNTWELGCRSPLLT